MLSLRECNVCPRMCGDNRYVTTGYCKAGAKVKINLYQRHFGEEPNLSQVRGSGTIFFSHCNTNCIYCQNFSISQFGWGKEISQKELVDIMLNLQGSGVNNINLVTPTHFTPLIIEAIIAAKSKGLNIPIVWNSNAYERVEVLKELEGLVDIYLPDFRYFDRIAAKKYSDAEDYPDVAALAIREMFRQVSHIKEVNELAVKGLMIRILLLPGNVNRVDQILEWIAENLGTETYISLMGQYYPTYRAVGYPEINRAVSAEEYDFAVEKLKALGFENGYIQERGSSDEWTPKFFEQEEGR
jgi:putative pyruvate formate lyase activating enzyme